LHKKDNEKEFTKFPKRLISEFVIGGRLLEKLFLDRFKIVRFQEIFQIEVGIIPLN
jgi:hypothetical protein